MQQLRTLSRIAFAALAGLLLILQPFVASAAVLTSRSAIFERNQPGVASNEEITFVTPSGVQSGGGDTIALNYGSTFNLSSVTFGDVDLFYGPVTGLENSASLAASPGVNIWGVSVSGNKLIFTAPSSGVLNQIPGGDHVVMRIGTNAAGGVNRIINPTGLGGGTIFLVIDGAFGDTGGFDIPIFNNTIVNVTAVVAATSTPGGGTPGGGGGGGTDGMPPTIFNVQAINITSNSATIIWQTDEPANGLVDYGLTPSYTNNASHTGYITSHSVDLSGLSASSLYHFRVTSADAVGNSASTGDFTFTTLAPPHAPVISNVQVVNITDSSAIVTWDTDIPANSVVNYGTSASYGTTITDNSSVVHHSMPLTGLTAATTYHLRVSSVASGLSSSSGDVVFSTLGDITPPANVFNFTVTPGDSRNTLNWTNPSDPDFAFVRIRARTDGYPTGPADGRFVYQGSANSILDSGLVNGTTYFYANYAYDAAGNPASGAFAQGTPNGPVIPPVIPPVTPPTTPGGTPTTTRPVTPTSTPPTTSTSTPPIVVPTSTTPVTPGIVITPEYFAANGTVQLIENAAGQIASIVGRPVSVRVPTAGLGRVPQSATIQVGSSLYALTPLLNGESWGATFVPSNRIENVPVTVTFHFADGTEARASTVISVQGMARILSREGVNPNPVALPGAKVTLYEMTVSGWQVWNGSRYGQANPMQSAADGSYGFIVKNGSYRIVAEKDGYQTQDRVIEVRQNVASVDIILPQVVETPVIGPILAVLQSPEVQQGANIAAPIAIAVAVANLALATSLFSIFNYLWFLFTQPLLLLGRRRRERWGLVYNSLAKTPIDLVAVRLVHARTNLILQTRVSDAKGRFTFRVRPGQYRIEAAKQGYSFPSAYLKGEKVDGEYLDIYHGEIINVEEETNIAVNIPMDPLVREETPRKVIFKKRLRQLQTFLGFLSPFVSLAALIISPSWLTAGLFIGQVLVYLLFRRLAKAKKPKGWGIVYDSKTRKPLGQTVVRIFDKKFNKLLETQVTDSRGNYGFFAKNNVYFVTADKTGFDRYQSKDIDLTNKEAGAIDEHIQLSRQGNKPPSTAPAPQSTPPIEPPKA